MKDKSLFFSKKPETQAELKDKAGSVRHHHPVTKATANIANFVNAANSAEDGVQNLNSKRAH